MLLCPVVINCNGNFSNARYKKHLDGKNLRELSYCQAINAMLLLISAKW